MNQIIYEDIHTCTHIEDIIKENDIKKLMLVCDSAFPFLPMREFIEQLDVQIIKFTDFVPNPEYESIAKGVALFQEHECESILAVGGGSAIDVAKCIKLYASMSPTTNLLEQERIDNSVPLLVVPTTAGTGSESTRYAAIYYQGEKQSITSDEIIPKYIFLDSALLKTLPEYHRKASMLDALCHSIESFWSVNSNEESIGYSAEALKLILEHMEGYINNTDIGNKNMMKAANLAGRAINITQTTAAHALCYKLTTLYQIAHGHAASICLPKVWLYMSEHIEACVDQRGKEYVTGIFDKITETMNCGSVREAIRKLESINEWLLMKTPECKNNEELELCIHSVNLQRLKNTPVALDAKAIEEIYKAIFLNKIA